MGTLSPRPICALCTRNARTVETPRVHVRVERCIVMRPFPLGAPCLYRVICFCHGAVCIVDVEWGVLGERPASEDDVENLSAFQKARD